MSPKEIAANVSFSIPPSLVIMQVKKSPKITSSSISPYSHNISFSPSSLHFRPDLSLLPTFSGHFSLLPIVYLPPLYKALKLFADLQGPICYEDPQNKGINLIVY